MNNQLSEVRFVGDRVADLKILKSLDSKRPFALGCGLTTRTIDPAVKAKLNLYLNNYPDIYDEFYEISGLSLFEREAKDLINSKIALAMQRAITMQLINENSMAPHDASAYLMASIMRKVHCNKFNEITSEEVVKGFSKLYWILQSRFNEFSNDMFGKLFEHRRKDILDSFSFKVVGGYSVTNEKFALNPQVNKITQAHNIILSENNQMISIGRKEATLSEFEISADFKIVKIIYIGDMVVALNSLDRERPDKYGLTTRTLSPEAKAELDKFLSINPDIYASFYEASGLSLGERNCKNFINDMIISALKDDEDYGEDNLALDIYDKPAYSVASILEKISCKKFNEITLQEVKGFSEIFWLLHESEEDGDFFKDTFIIIYDHKREYILECFNFEIVDPHQLGITILRRDECFPIWIRFLDGTVGMVRRKADDIQ